MKLNCFSKSTSSHATFCKKDMNLYDLYIIKILLGPNQMFSKLTE